MEAQSPFQRVAQPVNPGSAPLRFALGGNGFCVRQLLARSSLTPANAKTGLNNRKNPSGALTTAAS
jgi:hypothetical protein